jgi:catechol 2,3-dioxygenase-like lactoylglutathione lyase family enzyme
LTARAHAAIIRDMSLPSLRFGYFVLAVGDIAAMRDWYCTVLGFAVVQTGRMEQVEAEFAILEGHGLRLELGVHLGGRPQLTPVLPSPEFMDQLGWKVLTLHTDDLAALQAHLEAHGADVVWSARAMAPKIVSTLLRDPEGNLINVFGPPS